MQKLNYLAFAILIAVILGAGYWASQKEVIVVSNDEQTLRGSGVSEPSCSVSSTELATVGDDISATVLSANVLRAWASIQPVGTSTQDIYLSFDEGASAVVGEGLRISATSSPDRATFGLNTEMPYTGAVTGITTVATSSVLVTECNY